MHFLITKIFLEYIASYFIPPYLIERRLPNDYWSQNKIVFSTFDSSWSRKSNSLKAYDYKLIICLVFDPLKINSNV